MHSEILDQLPNLEKNVDSELTKPNYMKDLSLFIIIKV